MSSEDEWLATHKGAYRDTVAQVWWCGDDYCNCAQAQIIDRFRNKKVANAVVPVAVWRGTFYTDGEGDPKAYDELVTELRRIRDEDPERFATITIVNGDMP